MLKFRVNFLYLGRSILTKWFSPVIDSEKLATLIFLELLTRIFIDD